jgi:prepilin signal peptidase PulO-like enzyme (type II secretory pathway)
MRMSIDQVDRTVVTQDPAVVPGQSAVTTERHFSSTRTGPGPSEMTRRIIYLVFGLIQLVIGARIVLLLLNAREGNVLVSTVLNVSQPFVVPFEGILNSNSLHSAGSVLDLAAILALAGWTVLELVIFWVIGIFRREPA